MTPLVPHCNEQGMWAHPKLQVGKTSVWQVSGWWRTCGEKGQGHLLPKSAGTSLHGDGTPAHLLPGAAPSPALGWLIPQMSDKGRHVGDRGKELASQGSHRGHLVLPALAPESQWAHYLDTSDHLPMTKLQLPMAPGPSRPSVPEWQQLPEAVPDQVCEATKHLWPPPSPEEESCGSCDAHSGGVGPAPGPVASFRGPVPAHEDKAGTFEPRAAAPAGTTCCPLLPLREASGQPTGRLPLTAHHAFSCSVSPLHIHADTLLCVWLFVA